MCLGDVFNPATFINALRQLTARTAGTAIDRMKLVSFWEIGSSGSNSNNNPLKSACPHPCSLSGLLLQGASIHSNGGYLQESLPDANEMTTAPLVTIGFVKSSPDDESKTNTKTTNVPLFVSTSREEYLLDIEMNLTEKGSGGNNKWILAGTALFLREDD